MTDQQQPADTTATGIARIPLDPRTGRYDLPVNHHGDPAAPLTPTGGRYRYRWTDHDRHELVYAATAADLIAYWIPEYTDADPARRTAILAEHAVHVRDNLVAELVADAHHRGQPPTPEDEAVLLANLDQVPDVRRWDSPIPLVLLEGMYRPYTDRTPPASGLDGDVAEPSNIIWLRHANPDSYLVSLGAAGVIGLSIAD